MKEKDNMEEQSAADKKIHRLIVALSDPSIDTRHQAVRELGEHRKTGN